MRACYRCKSTFDKTDKIILLLVFSSGKKAINRNTYHVHVIDIKTLLIRYK